jgi:starch synthase
MSTCFYFHPDGYTTKGRQVMGRHVAGESFLQAALSYGRSGDLWIQVEDQKHANIFSSIAESCGRREPLHLVHRHSLSRLKQPGCLYLPGPGLGEWARHRTFHGDRAWSLCGITHTTASTRAMDAIAELMTAPVQPWDALICTSRAVHNNVQRILQAEADYLRHRLGATRLVLPQLPIIPLGVHAEAFAPSFLRRQQARQQLNIAEDAVVVLFVGRLAFHGKAHPLVMYQALEQAAYRTGRKFILVECGWYANRHIQDAFAQAASVASPSVRSIILDGRNPEFLRIAWNVADVFCSLSDNVQETFGITPIEAMAAGLPVVVSDWDGYRDTVRDGVDGFCIPTTMPPPGFGEDLATCHALGTDTYDMYCAYTSSLIAVDLEAAVQAFVKLANSADLRKKMGDSGRRRVLETYDWKVIIPRYEQLWDELRARRLESKDRSMLSHPWPARLDPFYGFAAYPTAKMRPNDRIELVDHDSGVALERFRRYQQLEMVKYVSDRMSPVPQLEELLLKLGHGPSEINHLVKQLVLEPEHSSLLFRSVGWLIKLGLVKVLPPV